jgi:hypothetical protein
MTRVVEGELETGDHEHPVRPRGAGRLAVDLGEVERERHLVDGREGGAFLLAPRVVGADDVVGDAEHIEATSAVEIDELTNRELAVAPARMRVKLAEQWPEASSHRLHRRLPRHRHGDKSGCFAGRIT